MELRYYQKYILQNVKDSFRRWHKRPLVVAPCGSGKTVVFAAMAQASQNKNNTVWFLVHRKELLDQTLDTFRRFDIPLETIHIGMVATVANRLGTLPEPDLIILDECHHSMAATWNKIIQAYPKAFVIGLTATPCRLDGKPLGAVYDDMIVGITTKQLIFEGYLSEYRYFAPAVADLSALKRKGRDFDAEQAGQLLSERAVFGDVIKHYRTHAYNLQAICYCTTIKHSQAMAMEFCSAGINAVHFDGETPKKQRDEIVQKYRSGEIQILCNVDLISEGFDCPDCECCILLRPTLSTALFIQQSMRALRPKPGKTAIILDHVNNYSRHGLPDDDHEWSLTDTVKPRKEYDEHGKLLVRQCPKCYYTYKTGPSACPNCGNATALTPQEIKNIQAVRLAEIKRNHMETVRESITDETTLDDCHTLAEIQAWCKKNGKKPGYGWYVWQNRRKKVV